MIRHTTAPIAAALIAALVTAASAAAHAEVSPPVVIAGKAQLFSLAVPTEKEGASTISVVLTVPEGFSIDSFVPAPGWKRELVQTGAGEEAIIQKVTWTGGSVPTGEDALFQFLALPSVAKTYTFGVEQTYSDGSVENWTGVESSDVPAPMVEAKTSLGGGGGSLLGLVALGLGAVGLVIGGIALLAGGGKRPLA